MPPNAPFPKTVAAFVALYLVLCGGAAILRGNGEFIFYLVVMLILIGMIYAVHRRVAFSPLTLWLLAIWGLLHMGGGTIPIPAALADKGSDHAVLYSLKPWASLPRYDQVAHVFGFFVATLAASEALLAATKPVRIGMGFAAACALMGVGFGALNEVVEFIAVKTLPDTNVGGYENTGWDLVSNTIGAGVGAIVVRVRGAPREGVGRAE